MRNLLALGAAGLIGFAGIGWYLGWYKIQTTPAPDGHRQISIDLNTPKIKEDVGKGKEKLRDYLSGDDKSGSNPPPQSSTTNTPGTPTGFQRGSDGGLVLPGGDSFVPVPPGGGAPKLPPPR